MSPNLRQAAHRALDILLDAIADEMSGTPPKRARRGPSPNRVPPPTRPLTHEEQAELDKRLARAGYKR